MGADPEGREMPNLLKYGAHEEGLPGEGEMELNEASKDKIRTIVLYYDSTYNGKVFGYSRRSGYNYNAASAPATGSRAISHNVTYDKAEGLRGCGPSRGSEEDD